MSQWSSHEVCLRTDAALRVSARAAADTIAITNTAEAITITNTDRSDTNSGGPFATTNTADAINDATDAETSNVCGLFVCAAHPRESPSLEHGAPAIV